MKAKKTRRQIMKKGHRDLKNIKDLVAVAHLRLQNNVF